MRRSLIGGAAVCALMALGLGTAAQAQDVPQDQPPADAQAAPDGPMAQMSPAQIQEQITELQQDLDNVKQTQAEMSGALKGTTMSYEAAPRFTDSSGTTFKVRGRILLDDVDVNIDTRGTPRRSNYQSNQLRARQLFLGVEGTIGTKFAYKLEGGARNGGTWAWDDAILEYKLTPDTSLIFGNQKSVGLENITSTRFTTFMDRGPYGNLLGIDYALGVGAVKVGPNYSIWAAVLGQSVNSPDTAAGYGSSSANEQIAGTLRATVAPINTDTQKLYFGVWGRYRTRSTQTAFNYQGNIVSNYNPVVLYQTGAVGDSDFTAAVEAAYILHNLSFQGEFANVNVTRVGAAGRDPVLSGPNFSFQTAYGFVSYFLTGEMRNLNVRGEIGRTTVLHPVDNGGMGAFEVAARFDYADLTDLRPGSTAPLFGAGSQTAAAAGITTAGRFFGGTLGFNWYPISYVRFMANYTLATVDNPIYGPLGPTRFNRDATVNVFQARAQLDF